MIPFYSINKFDSIFSNFKWLVNHIFFSIAILQFIKKVFFNEMGLSGILSQLLFLIVFQLLPYPCFSKVLSKYYFVV